MPKEEELQVRECFVSEKTNIVQSNFLIERKEKLSLPATQLLYTLTGMINKDDEDLKYYKVDVTYFAELWNIDLKMAYQMVADALTELNTKGIRDHSIDEKTGKKVFTTVNFISFGRYKHGEGYATVRIEPELKPHYIALQSKFTMYSLGNILQLQENGGQVNAMRTYELLKQYQKKGKRTFTVKEFKEQLGLITYDKKGNVIKEKYKGSSANLKIKVLDPAIEKINSSTDIQAEYSIKGRGNKAVIEFIIKENKQTFIDFSNEAVLGGAPDRPSEEKYTDTFDDAEWTKEEILEKEAELREAREKICCGFDDEIFDEFTLEQLEELRSLAWHNVDDEAIERHSIVGSRLIAKEFAVAEYVRRKILLCNAKGNEIKKRYGFIRNAVAENYK